MKTDLTISSLGNKFVDLRDALPGDAYKWSWERPLTEIKYLAIHHSATDASATAKEIAKIHVEKNLWGGIGYHFIIGKDGAVYYVGDISTARANVANLNEVVLGICLIGNFTKGQMPTSAQLDSCRRLCEFLINFEPLSNISGWISVKAHREFPGQSTICPGDSWPSWSLKLFQVAKPTPGVSQVDTSGSREKNILKSQVDNLQVSLATVEQKRISLQEALQEREKQLASLAGNNVKVDDTLTIISGLVKLYKFFFLPRKAEA